MQRGGQILEQGQPGAECGRLDHQSVLVDQSESGQRLVEGGAAVGDQVVPRFALEAPDLLLEVAAGDSRLGPVGVLQRLREDDPSSCLSTPHGCDLSSAATYPSIETPV